jgi:cardiolipin synthase
LDCSKHVDYVEVSINHSFFICILLVFTPDRFFAIIRIVASPGLTYAIALDMKEVALVGCVVFAFTDWLDGYIARTFDQKTVLGAFLDPVADKVFIGALTLGLAAKDLLPLPLAVVIVGRDVSLIAASFYIRSRERPPGAPFFDTTYSATFQITPSEISKANTLIQFGLITATLGNFATGVPAITAIEPLWWITAVSTIWSGASYLDGTGLKRLSKAGEYRSKPPPTSTTNGSGDSSTDKGGNDGASEKKNEKL